MQKQSQPRRYVRRIATLAICMLACALSAYGAGKKPLPAPDAPLQAMPFRYAELAPVITPDFYLPNGVRVDLNSDLQTIIESQINQSRYIRTQYDNQSRLIISGGITSFEVDVLQLNLKIGWNQNGAIVVDPGLPNASGELDFRLSSFSMDFKIYDRISNQVVYIAKSVDQSLGSLHFTVRVNIDQLGGVLDLLIKMKIAETIRKATDAIMLKIENDARFNLIPWQAQVLGVDLNANTVTINAGQTVGVLKNQIYSLYTNCARESGACYERLLSEVKISNFGLYSAEAKPYGEADSLQSVQAGDKVYVKIFQNSEK